MNIIELASQLNVCFYAYIAILSLNHNLFFYRFSIYLAGMFGVRHLQAFIMFLGLTLAYAMRVNMSVAIVAMTDKHAANPDYEVCAFSLVTIRSIKSKNEII